MPGRPLRVFDQLLSELSGGLMPAMFRYGAVAVLTVLPLALSVSCTHTLHLAAMQAHRPDAPPQPHPASRPYSPVQLAAVGTDDYPYRASKPDRVDPWDFLTRECTSFVAWRLNHDNRVHFTNHYRNALWGNAKSWAGTARQVGVRVNDTPAMGSVAQFPPGVQGKHPFGHVAYVMNVGDHQVEIEEYNHKPRYGYSRRWVSTAGINFLHFKDLPVAPATPSARPR